MQIADSVSQRPRLLIENKPGQDHQLEKLGFSEWLGESRRSTEELSAFVLKRSREELDNLVRHAMPTDSTANFKSARSENSSQTKILGVTVKAVQRYADGMSALKKGVDCYDWSKLNRPEIFIDLSGFNIRGDLELSIQNITVLLRQTSFEGELKLNIAGLVELRFHASLVNDVEIAFSGKGHLRAVEIEKSSWNGRFDVRGILTTPAHPALVSSVTLLLKPSNTLAGQLSLSKCVLNEVVLNRWTLSDDMQLIECRIEKFELLSTTLRNQLTVTNCFFVGGPALFLNTIFEKPMLFKECTFFHAPDFHGAKLHQNTRFSGCEFLSEGSSRKSVRTSVEVASYRVLKGHFGQQKDSRQEIAFYALEQRAERYLSSGDPVEKGISWIQDAVSGYGQSLTRAVYVFLGWNMAFGAVFQLFANEALKIKANGSIAAFPGFVLALQNAFNPLALFSDKGLVEMNSLYLYLASLLQALGSIGIVTLILLTMRGKFRKGSSSEG